MLDECKVRSYAIILSLQDHIDIILTLKSTLSAPYGKWNEIDL